MTCRDPSEIKRFFLWQNALGNEMIHPSSSVRALPQKDEMGTWGFICEDDEEEEEEGERWRIGWLC